ncbi:RDD family protein [Streptomyces sp. NPDC014685]|uniref:RDD family protein n=1 Tax=Streptomyces sp. NPDC014685 TaxID=3364881 RepID=UPI0036FD96A1
MSAPTPVPGDESPREGYYPDPSIPGYVRYWNGASWVPGTSRPAPEQGESAAAALPEAVSGPQSLSQPQQPQSQLQSQSSEPQSSEPAPAEETGPIFLDGEPSPGNRPEPASAWQADASRQTGFGGEHDRRVSWGGTGRSGEQGGAPDPSEPGGPAAAEPVRDPRTPAGRATADRVPEVRAPADGAPVDPRRPAAADGDRAPEHTVTIRVGRQGRAGDDGSGEGAGEAGAGAPPSDGTMTIRSLGGGEPAPARRAEPDPGEGTMTIRALTPRAGARPSAPAQGLPPAPAQNQVQDPAQAQDPAPAPAPAPVQAQAPFPAQTSAPAPAPAPAPAEPNGPAPQGGAASWAQQPAGVQFPGQQHGVQPQQPGLQQPGLQQPGPQPGVQPGPQPGLPQQGLPQPGPQQPGPQFGGAQPDRPDQPVVPWKPPVDDPFQQLAQAQAAARPAGLGKRFAARLIDTVVLMALAGAAGFPLVSRALDHIDGKIEAAKLSGETVTVWLVDSTTAGLFGGALGVFLVLGVLLEALPTAKWGRTLGKKLCGLGVRDIESHEPPSFGAALRRWLVYGVLGLLVIGVVEVLWCLIDKPWRQCWHDKAAHTFVAG